VPGEVLDVANRLLPHIADVPPATSIRQGTDALTYTADLIGAVRTAEVAEGSIGVIVPDARVAPVLDELAAAGIAAENLDEEDDVRVSVVPATSAKGLEFDSVVLLEPAEIVAAESDRTDGLRRLYVTLTRAVSRLIIVHEQPLPDELT
jgi:DNA helicase IV